MNLHVLRSIIAAIIESDKEKKLTKTLIKHYSGEKLIDMPTAKRLQQMSEDEVALKPPKFKAVYRGLMNVSTAVLKRMLGDKPKSKGDHTPNIEWSSDPARDRSWSLSPDEAVKYAEAVYTLSKPDKRKWCVVVRARGQRDKFLFNPDKISKLAGIKGVMNDEWQMDYGSIVQNEQELIAIDSIDVDYIWYAKDPLTLSRLVFQNLNPADGTVVDKELNESSTYDQQEGGRYESIYALVEKVFEKAVELKVVKEDDQRLIDICENDEEHSWVAEEMIPDPRYVEYSYQMRMHRNTKHLKPVSEIIANSVQALYAERATKRFPEDDGKANYSQSLGRDVEAYSIKAMPSKRYIRHRAEEIEMIISDIITGPGKLTIRNEIETIYRDIVWEIINLGPVKIENDPNVNQIVREYMKKKYAESDDYNNPPNYMGYVSYDILSHLQWEIFFWYTNKYDNSNIHKFNEYIIAYNFDPFSEFLPSNVNAAANELVDENDKKVKMIEIIQMPEQAFFDELTSRHV